MANHPLAAPGKVSVSSPSEGQQAKTASNHAWGPGYFESSWDLGVGLIVVEGPDEEVEAFIGGRPAGEARAG